MPVALSVIVPFYNSGSTLEQTLISLSEQTASDLEFILVNDGSTDTGPEIAENFIARYSGNNTFRLLSHPNNRGSSEAFNTGLKHAGGIYICKCDSDDTVVPSYYADMLKTARQHNADIVISPYTTVTGSSTGIIRPRRCTSLNDMPVNTVEFSLCNKIIRRALLTDHDIAAYPHIDRWDDLGIVARAMALKPEVAFCTNPGYLYRIIPCQRTLSRSHSSRLLRDHILTASLLEKWFIANSLDKIYAEFLHHLKFLSKVKLLRCKPRDVARWKQTFPETNTGITRLRHIPFHFRLLFATIAKLPASLSQRIADKF